MSLPGHEKVTVLLADARVLVRNGVKTLVCTLLEDVHFIEAQDADELVHAAGTAAVRLALVDPALPGMDGGWGLLEFARRYTHVPLVLVSAIRSPELLRQAALTPTVCAFVPMSASTEEVRAAVEAAMQWRRLPLHGRGELSGDADMAALTPRQHEIRMMVRTGMSNKRIAKALGITEGTVKNHITEILRTLKVTNRTQVARLGSEIE